MAAGIARNSFIYVLLALSLLLNLGGLASISAPLVNWTGFFTDLIDVYHMVIRVPLANLFYFISLDLPDWLLDVLVIWSGLILAMNITIMREDGETFFSSIYTEAKEASSSFIGVVSNLFLFSTLGLLLTPFAYIYMAFFYSDDVEKDMGRTYLKYISFIIFLFLTLIVINYYLLLQVSPE